MSVVHMRGFTLLELLVSIAIFAFLAVLMYEGTELVMDNREFVAERVEDLQGMQRAVRLLQTDFAQLYPRAVRDELGRGEVAALLTDRGSEFRVRLTRSGWRNPAGANRGHLQRVQYRYDEDTGVLYRDYWPVLDRVLGAEPREQELVRELQDFDVEFLDAAGDWQPDWPPSGAANFTVLPRAVRYRLEFAEWGEVVRLVEIPG